MLIFVSSKYVTMQTWCK